MCIAVPAEVVSSDGMTALVDVYGDRFRVDLTMMSEQVAPGDFLAVQARRFAVTKIAREEAEAARAFFEDIFPELAARVRGAGIEPAP
ncbi:MAG: HypC/HybG/HupF family hydrogenase formation chaperone [Alphaproteobacteria bacterium]|nr:HypC/HybG/HupF family hydrogenase formation chaperone [Alphaproteobacteria bacterium]MDE2109847.1 HypC/HybG/HupF family hydrogenase formation chaperone [Alphaproteobacteria bacterium]MDE2493531.1 HypC/HybG/HupF family hydrogenase formation chaperone [Alphaproteobacteria bacterium]